MNQFVRKRDTSECLFCEKHIRRGGEGVLGWGGGICKSCIAFVLEIMAASDPVWRDQQLQMLEAMKSGVNSDVRRSDDGVHWRQ
jgi:hypothetical protein